MYIDPSEAAELSAFADAVWQYELEGGAVRRRELLDNWQYEKCRIALHTALLAVDLLRFEFEHDVTIELYACRTELAYCNGINELCRRYYAALIEESRPFPWRVFVLLGIPADELRLQVEGDPHFLGERVFSRYRLDRRIGAGSFGVVYEAFDEERRCSVTLKCPYGKTSKGLQFSQRLLRIESQCLAELDGRGVPHYLETIRTDADIRALVMEFVEGRPLSKVLCDGPLPLDIALNHIERLADTVDLLHRFDWVHRDLKPDNLLVRTNGELCLIDLGLILLNENRESEEGIPAGTPGYMSPEMLHGNQLLSDQRADIWAIGAIAFEMITGRKFEDSSSLRESQEALNKLKDMSKIRFPELPQPIRSICSQSTTSAVEHRFDRAKEIADCVRQFRDNRAKDYDPLDKRSLAAWRLGAKLGQCYHMATRLEQKTGRLSSLDVVSSSTEERNDLRNAAIDVGMDLGEIIELLSAEALISLNVELPDFEIDFYVDFDTFERGVENGALGPDWLPDQIPLVWEYLSILDAKATVGLIVLGDPLTSCFRAAKLAYLATFTGEDLEAPGAIWHLTRLPRRVWTDYVSELNGLRDKQNVWLDFNREVERYLIFDRLSDYAADPLNPTAGGRIGQRSSN